jgi:hypothetical protein
MLEVVGQTEAFDPGQYEYGFSVVSLPLDDARKGIVLELTPDSKLLFGRRPARPNLNQEVIASGTGEGIEREIPFPKRTTHALQQVIFTAADATTRDELTRPASNADGRARISIPRIRHRRGLPAEVRLRRLFKQSDQVSPDTVT